MVKEELCSPIMGTNMEVASLSLQREVLVNILSIPIWPGMAGLVTGLSQITGGM